MLGSSEYSTSPLCSPHDGYEVITAGDGEEAVILAATTTPDLVVLDITMPNMNGYEACKRISGFSTVPIIFVTAKAEEANKMKGLELGAVDYITKPFSVDQLLARIEAVLQREGIPPPTHSMTTNLPHARQLST